MPDGPLSDEELEAAVRLRVTDASSFIDSEISPQRAAATKYYNGALFGDEQPGRSRVVSQDVKDTILAIMPSLLNIFFSSEHAVEYMPRTPEKAPEAEQATDFVNYILTEENQGFLTFQSWFKDALKLKVGIVKAWAEDTTEVVSEIYTGIDDIQRTLLHIDQDVRVDAERSYYNPEAVPDPRFTVNPGQPDQTPEQPAPPLTGAVVHDLRITRKKPSKKIRVICVPPEEFLISRNAVTVEDADFTAHRTAATASDLIAMGYPPEVVDECGGGSDSLAMNEERLARQPWATVMPDGMGASPDRSMRLIDYYECYTKIDYDGDGIAELRKVCLMGTGKKMVLNKPWDESPFATLCPDPEPHVFFGGSIADQTMDIQRIKSQILRLLLDSLAQAIRPRTWIVDGQVNQDDALNSEVGAVVRMRAPGMMGDLSTPFVGQAAFPVLQYMDDIREDRTGVTKASQGLDPDALQSSTRMAVAATLEAAQQHIMMIARIFAETGVKRLFHILLRLVTTHQDKARMVRLRNQWVNVNPSEWDKGMDVWVNTALGTGLKGDHMDIMQGIAQKQEMILQQLGPQNPIVSAQQYSNTLRRMCEFAGFRDVSQFFSQVPANWQPPPPPPQPGQDPSQDPRAQAALILAHAQQQQIQADIVKKQGELQLQYQKMYVEDATNRYRIEADTATRLAQIQAQFGMQTAQVAADIEAQNQKIESQEKIAAMQPAPAPSSGGSDAGSE